MKPALTILGEIITALARLKFCCSQVMSGSRRKFVGQRRLRGADERLRVGLRVGVGTTIADEAAISVTVPVKRNKR